MLFEVSVKPCKSHMPISIRKKKLFLKNVHFICFENAYFFSIFVYVIFSVLLFHVPVAVYAFLQKLTQVLLRDPISSASSGVIPLTSFPLFWLPHVSRQSIPPFLVVFCIQTDSSMILHHYLPPKFRLPSPLRPPMW